MGKLRAWQRCGVAFCLIAALAVVRLLWAWPRLGADPLAQGLSAYTQSHWNEALAYARRRLDEKPNDPEALRLLARASARLGRDDTAQALYRRLGAKAMAAEDYFLLADGLGRGKERPDVIQSALEMALHNDPRHPEALNGLVRFLAKHNQLEEATPLARRLSMLPGWEVRADTNLGILLRQQNDPAGAVVALRRALRHDPALNGTSLTPYAAKKLLSRSLLEINQPAEAQAVLEEILVSSSDSEASWLLNRALLQEGALEKAKAVLPAAQVYRESHPLEFEPSPYVGAVRCAGCHPANYRTQVGSRHAKTFHRTVELPALSLPAGPVADPSEKGVVHSIVREAPDRIRAQTEVAGKTLYALVDYILGSGDRGITLVGTDGSGRARELRLSHYSDGSGWDRTTGQVSRPPDPADYLGRLLGAQGVRLCLDCHTTNFRAARDRQGVEAADHGIGCERCHGPGANHLQAVEAEWSDLAIARPRQASGPAIVNLCGQCHLPRNLEVSRFDPGAIRFQSASLTWSRCYTESQGALSCVTCHNPHEDAQKSTSFYERKCLACHSSKTQQAPRDGTRPIELSQEIPRTPCPVNAESDCLKCHMPEQKTVVPHTPFTDHHIRVRATPAQRASG
jgi:tetratricopeptide (TPR) repeat protein